MESKYKSSSINLGSIRNLQLKCNTVVSFIDLSMFSIEQNVVPLMKYRILTLKVVRVRKMKLITRIRNLLL